MELTLFRSRGSNSDIQKASTAPNPNNNSTTSTKKTFSTFPSSFLLYLLPIILFSIFLLSSSIHLCIHSRKLQSYCIAGGIESSLNVVQTFLNRPFAGKNISIANTNIIDNVTDAVDDKPSHSTDHGVPDVDKQKKLEERAAAVEMVNNVTDIIAIDDDKGGHSTDHGVPDVDKQKKLEEIAVAVEMVREQMKQLRSWSSSSGNWSSCEGRGIFVYDLPSKFNKDLMGFCGDLLPWNDLCRFFANDAMGQPIPELGKCCWYETHQYFLEPIFHQRISNHPCRVYSPDEAKLFYVPFYAGLDILRWHFKNVSLDVKDALSVELVQWLETHNTWGRNSGRDHMFVLGKISWDFRRKNQSSWGSRFLSLDGMQGPYKFMIERQPWEINDIGIPHPTYFHPHSDDDIAAWQSRIISSWRRSLVSFAGAARPKATENIRSLLIKQCVASSNGGRDCKFLNCASGDCTNPADLITAFMQSEFCLQPPGDSPTRKSVFDSLVAGCIPVLFDPFTAYYQYPWHLPEDYRKYSVFIDQEEVREGKVDVVERLKRFSAEEKDEMRRYIVYQLVPGLVYGDAGSEFVRFRDAFGIVVDNMMDRVTKSDNQ